MTIAILIIAALVLLMTFVIAGALGAMLKSLNAFIQTITTAKAMSQPGGIAGALQEAMTQLNAVWNK